jgi:hypothetical protein
MSDPISEDALNQIADGSGRCYPHEGKAMAIELREFRRERAAVGSIGAPSPIPSPSTPSPWNGIP